MTGDAVQGFGRDHDSLRQLAIGRIPLGKLPVVGDFSLPVPFLLFVGLAIVAAVFLNKTIYGRYMLALGRNEQAARYSGINTQAMTILAYVICSLVGGFGALLFAFDSNSIQPDNFGNFYELYAIAAAVLGGCSLRGGEGSIFGVMIGAAILPLLRNSINLLGLPTTLEFAIIGFVILAGVIVDELVKRFAARRRRIAAAQMNEG
jgi:ribose transport system permease protein